MLSSPSRYSAAFTKKASFHEERGFACAASYLSDAGPQELAPCTSGCRLPGIIGPVPPPTLDKSPEPGMILLFVELHVMMAAHHDECFAQRLVMLVEQYGFCQVLAMCSPVH